MIWCPNVNLIKVHYVRKIRFQLSRSSPPRSCVVSQHTCHRCRVATFLRLLALMGFCYMNSAHLSAMDFDVLHKCHSNQWYWHIFLGSHLKISKTYKYLFSNSLTNKKKQHLPWQNCKTTTQYATRRSYQHRQINLVPNNWTLCCTYMIVLITALLIKLKENSMKSDVNRRWRPLYILFANVHATDFDP